MVDRSDCNLSAGLCAGGAWTSAPYPPAAKDLHAMIPEPHRKILADRLDDPQVFAVAPPSPVGGWPVSWTACDEGGHIRVIPQEPVSA